MKTRLDLHSDLCSLGVLSGHVAESLRSENIKGKQKQARCCPVANYLKSRGYNEPSVSTWGIWYQDIDGVAVIPLGVQSFIVDFDAGDYPDLIEVEDGEAKPQVKTQQNGSEANSTGT
jgi:hypothetical protein